MKEEYTPAEADILLLGLPGVGLKTGSDLGASKEPSYDENGWG